MTIFVTIFTVNQGTFSQTIFDPHVESEIGTPKFSFESRVLLSDSDSLSKVLFFVSIPYQNLQYIYSNQSYSARFIVSAELNLNGNKNQRRSIVKHWQDSLVLSPSQKNDLRGKIHRLTYSMDLVNGTFQLKLRIRDRISNKISEQNSKITIARIPKDELFVTDVLVVKTPFINLNNLKITSSEQHFTRDDSIGVLFEIKPIGTGTIKIQERIIHNDGRNWLDSTYYFEPKHKKFQSVRELDLRKFDTGMYQYIVQAEQSGTRKSKTIGFKIIDKDFPFDESEITNSLKQMKYILENDRLNEILKMDNSRQLQEFKSYWNSRDPTPETTKNERLEEYFKRINLANQRYTKIQQGWETDRGQVLVIYGEPSEIEDHPIVNQGRPYQIWIYNQLQLRFTFIDYDGFGDFRLANPLWE